MCGTIVAVIEEFFTDANNVLLYICDVADGKQDTRNKLFERWFLNHKNHTNFIRQAIHASIDGCVYHLVIMVSKQHPNATAIVTAFELYVDELVAKLQTT